MSALDNSALANAAKAQGVDIGTIKRLVAPFVWQWCREHQDTKVLSIKKRILGIPFSYSATVKDCEWLVTQLVGPDPSTSPNG